MTIASTFSKEKLERLNKDSPGIKIVILDCPKKYPWSKPTFEVTVRRATFVMFEFVGTQQECDTFLEGVEIGRKIETEYQYWSRAK